MRNGTHLAFSVPTAEHAPDLPVGLRTLAAPVRDDALVLRSWRRTKPATTHPDALDELRSSFSTHVPAGPLGAATTAQEAALSLAAARGMGLSAFEALDLHSPAAGLDGVLDAPLAEQLLSDLRRAISVLGASGRFAWQLVADDLPTDAPAPAECATFAPLAGPQLLGTADGHTLSVSDPDGLVLTDPDGSNACIIEFFDEGGGWMTQDLDGALAPVPAGLVGLFAELAAPGAATYARRVLLPVAFAPVLDAARTAALAAASHEAPLLTTPVPG